MKYFNLCILLLVGISCTKSKFILDTEKVMIHDILDNINRNHKSLVTLDGRARVTIESEEFNGNFFANIDCNDNDSLLLSIKGPFGIHAGTLFIGRDRFIIYNSITNKFYNGSKTDFENRNFLQFPLKISEIIPIFMGRDVISSMKINKYTIKDGMFFIIAHKNNSTYKIWINHTNGQIYKLEQYRDDTLQYIKEYGSFIRINHLYFPRKISIVRPNEKQAISIYYISVKVNEDIQQEKFIIDISDDAEQIDLSLEELN